MTTEREQSFRIEDGLLIRTVTPRSGQTYEHSCTEQVYQEMAHAIDALDGAAFTGDSIRVQIDAPFTQVAVAVAFMRERGCLAPERRRRSSAASDLVFEDAMIEWHALREGAPGSI